MQVMGFYEEAKNKIDEGKKEKLDRYGEAMKKDVAAALLDFCEQDAEFAQAVAQGGSFKDCMAAVSKGIGGSISDLEAYRRAVQFYFPGADIRFQMTIDLCASVNARTSGRTVVVDLFDCF